LICPHKIQSKIAHDIEANMKCPQRVLMPDDKDAIFLGDTYRVICDFPDDARRVASYQIRRVQQGKEPDD
jgi:hypothetical protein